MDDREELLNAWVETVQDYAIFLLDPEGRVASWNAGAERILGYTEAEILGQPAARFFVAEEVAAGVPAQELSRAAREGRASDDRWHVRKDGSRFWCNGVSTALRDQDGSVRGFVKAMRDLTREKLYADELAASEARFRSIAEQSPVLIWRSDPLGHYDYFNKPWFDFTGRTPEQQADGGLGWLEGIHPDDRRRYLDTYAAAIAHREPFEVTFRLRRRDGLYRWVADRGAPFVDARGEFLGFLGSCLDITERVELEEVLRRQHELAEDAAQHKTRLMAALSHDARTPLNALVLAADSLEMHLGNPADPEVEHDLGIIRRAVRNMLDLLGDLLDLVRIDSGGDPARVSRFALEPALAECTAGIEPQALQKGLEVGLELGDLAGAVIETDRAKLKQILSNLLSNALRFTERGRIRVAAGRSEDQLRITVQDTGIGIATADQVRVFEEFARLEHPHRPVGEGTGLGLAICRRLASLLGGEIRLESAPGCGSTFTLALPAAVLATAENPMPAGPPPAGGPAWGLVLVVEDDLASRQALARILRRMGYRVEEAGNGRDALEQVFRERPMAVLMDVNMPVMDGIEATRALRADPATRDLRILALTGDVTAVNQLRIGEAGVDGYLEKPVNKDTLDRALSQIRNGPA